MITIGIWFLRKKLNEKNWPYMVPLIEERGQGGRLWKIDRAKRVRDSKNKNIQFFQLQNKKDRIPTPEYKDIYLDVKGKNVLPLYSPQENQYFPLDLKTDNPHLHVEDKNVAFFGTLERERVKTKYSNESWLIKYMPLIGILAVVGMLLFVVIWQGNITLQIASQTSQNIKLGNDITDRLAKILGGAVPATPPSTAPLGG